jgi:hypothetical protein
MKFMRFLFIGLGFAIGAGAQGECLPASSLLQNALSDLNGFSYIRNQMNEWRAEGDTLCATGIPLEKNIYQYFRWFIQIEVRSASGELKAMVPVLFQTASVQAHDNTGPKPWAVMPYSQVQSILGQMHFSPQETVEALPLPSSPQFASAVQKQSWAQGFDADSFSITRLSNDIYMIGWLALVRGTDGNFFTQIFSPKIVLLRYQADGRVEVDPSHSGYQSVLAPLDQLLNSIPYPSDEAAQQQMVRDFSKITALTN